MRSILILCSIICLLFNASGAIYGGLNLMVHRVGSSIVLSSEYLQCTFFKNYFIPGLILFIANGHFDLVVFVAILLKYKYYPLLILSAGAILAGWLIIQIAIIQVIYCLQFILGAVPLGMIVCGWILF